MRSESRVMTRAVLALALAVAAGSTVVTAAPSPAAASLAAPSPAAAAALEAGTVCLTDLEPGRLGALFDAEPGGVVGADYQRALALPDGRVFWTFQDAAVRVGPDDIRIVHNIAVIQEGLCFTIRYGGTRAAPQPMFFAGRTVPFTRWFWPLDSAIGDDGRVYVYAAEMEERGEEYLTHTVPVRTHVAVFDPATDSVVDELLPPDSTADLYGWSITSDNQWTYLYAHCYRQFGFDMYAFVAAFDRSCSTRVTVARVPRGKLFQPLSYWDGQRWQPDRTRATSIIPSQGRRINADQFEWTGARFVSVNKEGDWWGEKILLAQSTSPTGPFEVYEELKAPVKCAECNSFFATWVPAAAAQRSDNAFVISLAHNRWDGVITSLYRPTFHLVPAPTHLPGRSTFELQLGPGTAAINVVAVQPEAPGFITVYPCKAGLPLASNVNHVGEPVVANLVLATPDDSGRVCLYSLATTNLVVDVAGSFGTSSAFQPRNTPLRIVDTRDGTGAPRRRVAAGTTLRFDVPGGASAEAVAINVVAANPSGPGHLAVFACDREQPATSNINYITEPVVSNLVIARPSADGAVCIFTLADVDLVVDLAGTFSSDGYVALDDAVRLADTRLSTPVGRLRPGGRLEVTVPVDATAAILNVIAVNPSKPGFLTVAPCDEPWPATSNVNYINVPVVSNLVIARPSAAHTVCVSTSAEADVVVDLFGSLTGSSGFEALAAPRRLVDTRVGTGVPGQLGVR